MNTMKSWLRDDRVYQAIMNGALWIVVIAALSTTKWPQFGWITGSITAVLVVIVAAVYWIAVVTNDNDKPGSTRQSTQLATGKKKRRGGEMWHKSILPMRSTVRKSLMHTGMLLAEICNRSGPKTLGTAQPNL